MGRTIYEHSCTLGKPALLCLYQAWGCALSSTPKGVQGDRVEVLISLSAVQRPTPRLTRVRQSR